MNYTFSKKVDSLKPSAIREILKFTSIPGFIPFSAGNPSPEAFPVNEVNEIIKDIMTNRPIDALQYSITEGYTPLRDRLKKYMTDKHSSFKEFDELIITSGAQQVIELATKSLCDEGDTIICEEPSFIGSLNAFRSYGVNLCGVPLEHDGINLEKLEHELKTQKNVRFIYVIPTFQNPSGVTMSLSKRKALYALALKYNVIILEDNPYSDLRFSGENVPTIKSLDTEGIVLYAGSFSKVLAPGIRVGYAIAPAQIISKLVVCKQVSDVHTNIMFQIVADEFMGQYDFDAHLQKLRDIYRKKATLMTSSIDKNLSKDITYNAPEGGLFVWCTLPSHVDMLDYCKRAIDQKVALVPGSAFIIDGNAPCSNFRMNFSTPSDEQIIKGLELLGKVSF